MEGLPNFVVAAEIVKAVSKHRRTPFRKLNSPSRARSIVTARKIAMYLLKELTDYTLEEIGRIFNRSHATVLYCIEDVKENERLMEQVTFLMSKITSSNENLSHQVHLTTLKEGKEDKE